MWLHYPAQCYGCVSFAAIHKSNMLMRAGKKVEGFRHCWIFMDVGGLNNRLELPTELLEKPEGWGHEKPSDPWAEPVLRKMTADMEATC